jgi:hypothetical protein
MRVFPLSITIMLLSMQLLAGQFLIDLRPINKMLYLSTKDQRFAHIRREYAESICKEKNGELTGSLSELASTLPAGTEVLVPDYGNCFPLRNSIQYYPLVAYENGKFRVAHDYAHEMSYLLNQSGDQVLVEVNCETGDD